MWRKIPRLKLYMVTSFCTLTSSLILLSEEKNQALILVFWALLGSKGLSFSENLLGFFFRCLFLTIGKEKHVEQRAGDFILLYDV